MWSFLRRQCLTTAFSLLLVLWLFLCSVLVPVVAQDNENEEGYRIAIIGGGISGTFVSKYLIDYAIASSKNCPLAALDLFDPVETIGAFTTTSSSPKQQQQQQPSRVATYRTETGAIVEVGASIFSEQFVLIREMAKWGNLTMGPRFATGKDESTLRQGLVVSNGRDTSPLINTAMYTEEEQRKKKLYLLYRYNMDLLVLSRAVSKTIAQFARAQASVQYDNIENIPTSPKELWDSVGLSYLVHQSLDAYCDSILMASTSSSSKLWSSLKSTMGWGTLRDELLAAISLGNYNQDNSQINALSGLASFSVTSTPVYSIAGGNVQLLSAAFSLAQNTYQSCRRHDNGPVVRHVSNSIRTVVGSSVDGFTLYDDNGVTMGDYDLVILAAPLSMAQIDFLIKSNMDGAVLQPMPMGGLIANLDHDPHEDGGGNTARSKRETQHDGHDLLPKSLPKSATRPYTQVVTTLVTNVKLNSDHFGIDADYVPRGIYLTPTGKAREHSVTSIAQLSTDLYKVFSSDPLSPEVLRLFFGSSVQVEHEQVWGGPHGGATPDYQGGGRRDDDHDGPGFILYDGAIGFHGHTKSGALYYPNALELSLACTETSAMGAKIVAKLIAQRLGWVDTKRPRYDIEGDL